MSADIVIVVKDARQMGRTLLSQKTCDYVSKLLGYPFPCSLEWHELGDPPSPTSFDGIEEHSKLEAALFASIKDHEAGVTVIISLNPCEKSLSRMTVMYQAVRTPLSSVLAAALAAEIATIQDATIEEAGHWSHHANFSGAELLSQLQPSRRYESLEEAINEFDQRRERNSSWGQRQNT